MNKKGLSLEVELVMSAILFITMAIILIIINQLAIVNVEATIDADYAEFACNTDLMNFVNFDAGGGKDYGDLLQEAVALGNGTTFSVQTKNLLDSTLGAERWNMNIYVSDPQEVGELLPIIENISEVMPFANSRTCSTFLPVPCERLTETLENCIAVAELEVRYG